MSRQGLYFLRFATQLFADAGFRVRMRRTVAADRLQPLEEPLRAYLTAYLADLYQRVEPYLSREARSKAAAFLLADSPRFVADQEAFSVTLIHGLVVGERADA